MAESGEDSKRPTKVLIGIDNSENCQHAFEYYVDKIHMPDNEVILFHVSDQVKMPTYALLAEGVAFSVDDVRQRVEELKRKNKELKEKYKSKCDTLKIRHKFVIVTEDNHGPGHAIVEASKKHEVDLIVVGSRGLGAIRRTVMGSISTYVIHHSHIPALVCPTHHH